MCVYCSASLTLCCTSCGFFPERSTPPKQQSSQASAPQSALDITVKAEQTMPSVLHNSQLAQQPQSQDSCKSKPAALSASTMGFNAVGAHSAAADSTASSEQAVTSASLPEEPVTSESDGEDAPLPSTSGSDADPASTNAGSEGASVQQNSGSCSKGQALNSKRREPVKFRCPYCNLVFSSREGHKVHVKTHDCLVDGKGVYTCNVCGKTFPDFDSLYNHLKTRSNQQSCSQCSMAFTSRCQVSKHMRKHEKEKTRFCSKCNESFPSMSKRSFEGHLNRHLKEEKVKPVALCPECGKMFKNKADLNDHMTYHNKESPFPCTFPSCNKAFKNKSCLRQHALSHGEKTQQCEICGAKFFRKPGLRRHMQKHFGKQFCCDECPHRFCSAHALKVHIESVHKGIKSFACSMCELKFYQSHSLKKHMRIHTGEKPFQCEQCPARFSIAAALRKHMLRHTGEKPYRCEDCGQAYSCRHSFTMHRKKHHSSSVYTCECGQAFAIRPSLDFHRKMCHDIDIIETDMQADIKSEMQWHWQEMLTWSVALIWWLKFHLMVENLILIFLFLFSVFLFPNSTVVLADLAVLQYIIW